MIVSLIFVLATWFFRQGLSELWQLFRSFWLFDNTVAFGVIAVLWLFMTVRKRAFVKAVSSQQVWLAMTGLTVCGIALLLNQFWLRLSIVPPVLVVMATYFLMGLVTEERWWKRSLVVFVMLVLALPLLERVQKFVGFPLRLITAGAVSVMLEFLGVAHVSEATIIMTENRAATIDLPCSGVTSLYTGTLFLLVVIFLQRLKLSGKVFLISLGFWLLLIGFNIWRVFSLVYVYSVMGWVEAGNTIHVLMGVVGFVISCVVLWWLTKGEISVEETPPKVLAHSHTGNHFWPQVVGVGVLLVGCFAQLAGQRWLPDQRTALERRQLTLPNIELTELAMSDQEKAYFATDEVVISTKYQGTLTNGKKYSLLIVGSTSARKHHDPETCLQGLGHKITDTQVIQLENTLPVRQLRLNDNNDVVYYWFVSKDKTVLDYSERVWEELHRPGQLWVLVQVGFAQDQKLSDAETAHTLQEISRAVQQSAFE
jgi:exosortase O